MTLQQTQLYQCSCFLRVAVDENDITAITCAVLIRFVREREREKERERERERERREITQ